ncbi:MAG TPA: hypothetical protein ENL46_06470 [Candidatus Aminicenantes bacterium]|nr:hypothetical protein [Candidatus Aminicenantes bacterium]
MGCYCLPGSYRTVDIQEYKKALDCAIENRMAYFNTAQRYGVSEGIFSSASLYELFQTRTAEDREDCPKALDRVRLEMKGFPFPEE